MKSFQQNRFLVSLGRPFHIGYGSYLQLSDDLFLDPKEKQTLKLSNKIQNQNEKIWKDNQFHIPEDGFYIVQMTCLTDIIPYSAKLSIRGDQNHTDKIIHDGENSFIIYLKGEDHISFEIENHRNKVMLQDSTTLYIVKL